MATSAWTHRLATALVAASLAGSAGANLLPDDIAFLVSVVGIGGLDADVTGAYGQASAQTLADVVDVDNDLQSSATGVDVTASSAATGASSAATGGATFPDPSGSGGEARAAASGSSSVESVTGATGLGFVVGDFTATSSNLDLAAVHSVTVSFDIDALVSASDDDASDPPAGGSEILAASLSAFGAAFDDTGVLDSFSGGFSIEELNIPGTSPGIPGTSPGGLTPIRSADWAATDFDSAFDPDPGNDCADLLIPSCAFSIVLSDSLTFEFTGPSFTFSLVYGIQSSILGLGSVYTLDSDAGGTAELSSIVGSAGVTVSAQPSQLAVPEPAAALLLAAGLVGLGMRGLGMRRRVAARQG